MTMPLMPGLVGGDASMSGEGGDGESPTEALVEVLNAIGDEVFAQLLAEASGGEGESTETPEEEAAETQDQQEAEAAAQTEQLEVMQTNVDAAVEEVGAAKMHIEELVDLAKENEDGGGDPKAVEKILEQCEKVLEEAEDLKGAVSDAIKDEDPETAAEAAMKADELSQKARGLMEQAEAEANASSPMGDDDEENPTPAMAMWANKVNGGG